MLASVKKARKDERKKWVKLRAALDHLNNIFPEPERDWGGGSHPINRERARKLVFAIDDHDKRMAVLEAIEKYDTAQWAHREAQLQTARCEFEDARSGGPATRFDRYGGMVYAASLFALCWGTLDLRWILGFGFFGLAALIIELRDKDRRAVEELRDRKQWYNVLLEARENHRPYARVFSEEEVLSGVPDEEPRAVQ